MEHFKINQRLGNSDVIIVPQIMPQGFDKVEAFLVEVTCSPAYKGGDKELMIEVCKILSKLNTKLEIRTDYVVNEAHIEGLSDVSFIRFQVLTPLCPQWYR